MDQSKNIGFEFKRIADENQDKPAIIAEDIVISYGKLMSITEAFALRMQERGVNQSSTIAVKTNDMIVSLATMLASSLLGARYIAFQSDIADHDVIHPTHYFRSPDANDVSGYDFILMDQNWAPAYVSSAEKENLTYLGYTSPTQPWWILRTSGTTGTPKYLHISQTAVFDRSLAVRNDFVPHKTVFCSLFKCSARPFFVRATAALLNSCTIVDSLKPEIWAKTGVNLVCGSLSHANEFLGKITLNQKIPILQLSGSKIEDSDVEPLFQNFDTIEDVYGSSETNKSFVNIKTLCENGNLVTSGKPLDSQLEIIDDSGKLCAVGETGTVRIKNTYMSDGYLNAPEAQSQAFRYGWFYPGDLGRWGENGELIVTSRTDSILNLGGNKIDPVVVESTLCEVDGVTAAVCFQNPLKLAKNQLLAFIVVEDIAATDTIVSTAHSSCLNSLGVASTPRKILVVEQFPRSGDGTPLRDECKRLALKILE